MRPLRTCAFCLRVAKAAADGTPGLGINSGLVLTRLETLWLIYLISNVDQWMTDMSGERGGGRREVVNNSPIISKEDPFIFVEYRF